MSSQKNFVVTFRSDSININNIMEGGFGKNITDIIIAINSYSDFEEAKRQKIPCIQDYIYKNMKHIDFLIYLYGQSLVITDYVNRFGPITDSPILEVDFATIIIDNIIVIYEACQFPENTAASTRTVSVQSSPSQQFSSSPPLTPNSLTSYTEMEEYHSTSRLIASYDNRLTEEDARKFLS